MYNAFPGNKDILARGFVDTPAYCNPWVKLKEPMRRCAISPEMGLLAVASETILDAQTCLHFCSKKFEEHYLDYVAFDGSLMCNGTKCLGSDIANNPLWCSHSSEGDCQVTERLNAERDFRWAVIK